MLTLSLLRHAKSGWDDSSLKDFDRPLSERGETAAPRMGAYMAAQGLAPDLVLCSPAVRACRTLDLVLPHLAGGPTVVYEDNFYLAAPSVLLQRNVVMLSSKAGNCAATDRSAFSANEAPSNTSSSCPPT